MKVPIPKKGEDARSYAAKLIGKIGEANQKIVDSAAQYDDVRRGINP